MSKEHDAVGFVGLGAMGFPMAVNLGNRLPSKTKLYVFDVAQDSMNRLLEQEKTPDRIHSCTSACEVASKSVCNARNAAICHMDLADIVLSMVPEGNHVRSVYLTPEKGILAAKSLAGKLLIDCSTIDTATSLAVRDAVATNHPNASFYDAPVSGGVLGAEKATMTFMLGCAKTDPKLPKLRALLSLMGGSIFPCGGPSLGLTAKLCNNYCSGLIAIATSEAMNVGIKCGMDPRILADVFHTSLAQSCINDKWNPCPGICPDAPASKGYQGGFKVQLMRKDFALAVDTADRVGAKLALGEMGLRVYTEAMADERCKDLDSRVVYRFLGGDEEWAQRFPSDA